MMRKILLALLTAATPLMFSANTSLAAEVLPTVTVAATPSIDMVLMIVAVEKGFLEREGLSAKLQMFDSSPGALHGVTAGLADITNNTAPPQLAARARGAKIVQVMTAYLSGLNNGDVVNGKVIHNAQDFVGKTIGVQRGSGADYDLTKFLEFHKIPRDKIQIKYLDAPDQIPALARGDIQGFFSWEPFLTRATQIVPGAKIFSVSKDEGVIFASNVVMSEDMAKNHKPVAVKIVKGLIAAADWIRANPEGAAEVSNNVLKAPSLKELTEQIKKYQWVGDFKRKVYENEVSVAQWGAKIGLFPAKDPAQLVKDMIYPEIIKEAAPHRTDF
ncbi:MAG: ABC transporter substrate-binding protein [Candidimonas sp.]|nr:MAG: ABC transporter substrate-binding protein [Candidimonas sp.]TAM22759.1 MAG: ABC transporter substrate-binding protein [Candidimonas sp.]